MVNWTCRAGCRAAATADERGRGERRPRTDTGTAGTPARAGRGELGTISIADQVVTKIAATAAAENPDAGAAVARVAGRAVPGAGSMGVRGTDLDALPKTTVEVDGSKAFVHLEISVRWPSSRA